jgi:hypothetical protein
MPGLEFDVVQRLALEIEKDTGYTIKIKKRLKTPA